MGKRPTKPSYELHPSYEAALVAALASRPTLWDRVGRDLDPDRMREPSAALAVRLMHEIARERGRPARTPMDIIQQAQDWRQKARVTFGAVTRLAKLFDDAADGATAAAAGTGGRPLLDDDAICARMVPVLRHALAEDVRALAGEAALETDPGEVQKALVRIEETGKEVSGGVRLGPQTWALIEQLKLIPRLPTGILELDADLRGGAPRGTLSTLLGCAKAGKTTFMVHVACAAALRGVPVAFATLELSEDLVAQKIKANLTGVPLGALVNGEMPVAVARLAALELAPVDIRFFAPGAQVSEVDAWLDSVPSGGLLCVDYADRMTGEGKRSFEQMRDVYQKLSDLARRREMWIWTATQATREAHGSKHVGIRHVAGSVEKIRIADLILTLTKQTNSDEAEIYITNRHGVSGDCVRVQTDFTRARFGA